MAWTDIFLNFLGSPKKAINKLEEALPVAGGRRSVPDGNTGILRNGAQELSPLFQLEYIEQLKHLSVWNRHVSKLVSDVVALANTSYEIELPDDISARVRSKALKELRTFEVLFAEGKGLQDFIKNGLSNLVTTGSLPAEMVIKGNPYPNDISKIAILNAARIRFEYQKETDTFLPYQYVNNNFSGRGSFSIPLNTETFIYATVRQIEENPYGIPELLSSLDDLELDADMIKDFKSILRNAGLMGFLTVFVQPPARRHGETEEQYFKRTQNYLNEYVVPDSERGLRSGIMAGYKGATDIEFKANNANYSGADKAFEMVNKRLYNGMKSHGLFFGETGAITETFARVILQIMMSMVGDYQYAIAGVMQKVFLTLLKMKGFDLPYLKVKFESAMIGDELREAQTEQVKIANVAQKLNLQIISLEQAAQELGYDKPTDTPFAMPNTSNSATNLPQPQGNRTDPSGGQLSKKKHESILIHGQGCGCGTCSGKVAFEEDTEFGDAFLDKKTKAYKKAVGKVFGEYIGKIEKSLKRAAKSKERTESEMVELALSFATVYLLEFEDSLFGIDDYVNQVYRHFRADKKIFPKQVANARLFDAYVPPNAVLDFLDLRLIDYLSESDRLYLGKYASGKMREDLERFIKERYAANDGRIGDSKTLDEFMEEFKEHLEGKSKSVIRRIIDTTMNNARSYAHVKYMHQAGVLRFRRVEVGDSRTCAHCNAINGKEFEVAREISKAEKFVASSAEDIGEYAPFATTIPINDFEGMTSEQIQEKGVGCNSLHPHCRGRNVAVL